MPASVVNDVHSRLNRTRVADVVRPDSLAGVQAEIARARAARRTVAIAGGRHSMGGQQFCSGGILLDTTQLDRVLSFDPVRGTVECEAGTQWPELVRFLERAQRDEPSPWTIRQKQTGANRLSLGGAVSANAHGRGLAMRPIVADVESLVVVDATGIPRRCSREEEGELFRLVVGGYGLFGVVYSVTLRLARRRTLERLVELCEVDDLVGRFAEQIDAGFLYGDFQFGYFPLEEALSLARGLPNVRLTVTSALDHVRPRPSPEHVRGLARFNRFAVRALAASR